MTAPRPSYAPRSPRRRLPASQRLRLRLRQRARRGWSVPALLDERRELLGALDALDRARETVAAKLQGRALKKPAAREALERANGKAQATFDAHAERVRHQLLLDDGILSSHGVRPWEQDGGG
jgi:hypothetical protein